MPHKPSYVGLTGVRTPDEAEQALSMFHAHGFQPGRPHTGMIGVLASPATIRNAEPLHCNKPWRQVQDFRTLVDTLLAVGDKGLPMVHMELHKQWPGTPGDADDAIALLKALAYEGVEPAIQLNGIVAPDDIKRIHSETGAAIMVQFRKEMTSRAPGDVRRYIESVHMDIAGILTDESAGTSRELVPARAAFWQKWLSLQIPGLTFGHAGGLNRSNVTPHTKALRQELGHAHFSLDIESGARWQTGDSAQPDALDLEPDGAFGAYLKGVVAGFAD